MGKKKWEKNNGESGGLPLFETYNGKKKNKKESAFLYTFVSPALAFSTQNTPLDDTTCGYQKKKEEEKRTLGTKEENRHSLLRPRFLLGRFDDA